MFVKVEVTLEKYPYLCNEWTYSYTFAITTRSNSSNFWVRLALDKIVYCENITTYIKSHLNRKYAMDLFLNLYKKWNRNYTTRTA